LAAGLRPDPPTLGSLQRSPDPLAGFKDASCLLLRGKGGEERRGGVGKRGVVEGRKSMEERSEYASLALGRMDAHVGYMLSRRP